MKKRGKKRKKKRQGLSTIVITLIVILVSLVAIGIIWVVVRNLIKTGTEQISSGVGQFLVSLELQKVYVKSNGDVEVIVKRNTGAGDLTEIDFIISDGTNTETVQKDTTLKELETATFTINSSEFGSSVGLVKEISILPVMDSMLGGITDTVEVSNLDILRNLNAVAWWKLDGNANDEIGSNSGVLQGGASFIVGRFGQAGSLDGGGDYIQISNESNFDFKNNFTLTAWIKPIGSDTYNALITKFSGAANGWDWLLNIGTIRMTARGTSTIDTAGEGVDLRDGNWHHIVAVVTPLGIQQYEDGRALTPITGNWTSTSNNILPSIGYRSGLTNFNGTMDEIIIFNRSLTSQQVKSLYQLNLNSS